MPHDIESASRIQNSEVEVSHPAAADAAPGHFEDTRTGYDLDPCEARFRVALAHSGVIVFEHDPELRYTFIYPTQFYETAQVIGKTDAELFEAQDAARLMAIKREVLRTRVRAKEEVYVVREGRRHDFVLTVEPRWDAQGRVIGLAGASTNITAMKQAQEQLARALEFRDQVIGILGHDLRIPLNAIAGSTQSLLGVESVEDKLRPLLRIERSARRMVEMIGTLLDFADSRFNGRLPILPAQTNLADIIRAVIDELLASNPGRSIGLDVDGNACGAWDAARIAQVGSNLLDNALKHGAEGGPVRVRLQGERADVVILEVENGGPPIPGDRLPLLFKPFCGQSVHTHDPAPYRGAAAPRGLGLGLYIADQIVRAHGGSIEVRSKVETGTVFRVCLPR